MKNFVSKRNLCIVALATFLCLSFALTIPLYRSLSRLVSEKMETFRSELEKNTGLSFSYDSFSPSILTFFSIKGIVLKTVDTEHEIAKIKSVSIRYSIFNLLRRNIEKSFKSLTINGLSLDYNEDFDKDILTELAKEKIFLNKDDNTGDKKITSEKKSFILQNENDFHFQIPLDIFLRNISIRYQKKDLVATYTIKRASLLNTSSKNVKSLKVDSNIAVQQKKATLASGKISLNGTLNENLEKSSVLLQFSNFLAYDVQFGKMQFLCSYNDGNALLKSIAHSYPILLDAKYNIRNSIISVDFKSENFVLSSFASSRKRRELLRKIGGTSLSLNSRVEYNILEKSLLYDSHGAIYLPNTLVPSGVNVVHTLSGNQDAIEFTRLNLQGSSYDATSYIRYAFKNKNLFGSVNLNRITLPNGTDLSGELFLDSFSDSFVCFAPEIILEQKVLTALELSVFPSPSSIDVHFELSDYSHPEAENVGSASLDLTYLLKQKYAQISLGISDFFLDAVAEISSAFLSENISKNVRSFASSLSPYMIAGELYASTDFKSVSYNVPFLLAANTQKDNQFLLASISGNENNFQIPRMNIIFGANNANINFSLNKEPASDSSFFTLDVNTKTVPYHFIGNIVDRSVSVSGDYGFTLQANANQQGELTGSFSIENFPFEIGKGIMWLSSNAGFAYTEKDGFALSLARFEAEDKGDAFSFSPKFVFSGNITRYGALFDSILYSDKFSTLIGKADCLVNINDKIFDSLRLNLQLADELSGERIASVIDITNPDKLAFSSDMLKNNVYMNAEISCIDANLNRFLTEQSANNTLTCSVSATGTLENPYIGISLDNASFMFAGTPCSSSGSASVEGRVLHLHDINASYGNILAQNISGEFNIDSFSGKGKTNLSYKSANRSLSVPVQFSISDLSSSKKEFIPDSFSVTIFSEKTEGTFFAKNFPFSISLQKTPNISTITSSKNLGLTGTINSLGDINIKIDEDKPLHFSLSGRAEANALNLNVYNLYVDLAYITDFLTVPFIKIYKGIMQGDFKIGGLRNDPDFSGELVVTDADWSLPTIVPSHITRDKFFISLEHNEITMHEVTMKVKNDFCNIGMTVFMDRWSLDRVEGFVRTPQNKTAPAALDIRVAKFDGMTSVDLDIIFEDKVLEVTGKVYVEDVKATVRANEIIDVLNNGQDIPFDVRTDLHITAGSHVNVTFDPLLRCVLVPGTQAVFKMDQSTGSFSLDGDIRLKSGDITYFNRNFYLKEGVIKCNDSEAQFNPRLTVRAETRERDRDGRDIRIVLSSNNQSILPIDSFVPQISTVPAKSEAEIRTLLGQIAVGDSSSASDVLLMAGDYALQSLLLRNVENSLREVLNFDIFSLRTMILQNVVRQGVNGTISQQGLTVGNLFDNSTVYIGKYFGSVVYVDALAHITYDESRWSGDVKRDPQKFTGISFRPEFGFELEAPFTNIRWSFSPDILAMTEGVFMPASSLTLSWHFSF